MATMGRNQPCPCGSGKRYKECHGAIDAANTASAAPSSTFSWVPQVMHEALRAQRSGRARDAAEGYRRVLAADPSNFDATHMLALVEYEQGLVPSALVLLRQAIELRPDITQARYNLRVLEAMPLVEEEIGREVLPRLMSRVEPLADIGGSASPGSPLHLVVSDELDETLRGALERLAGVLDRRSWPLWVQPGFAVADPSARIIDVARRQYPESGTIILFGAARSPLSWLVASRPDRVVLVVTREDPCAVIDRIDELSGLGVGRPGLVCATRQLAERLRLPRRAVLPERETSAVADA